MHLSISRVEGLRNDLLLRLERAEIETWHLSVAHRARLMQLPGMLRHRLATTAEQQGIAASKILIEDHLRQMGLVDDAGRAAQRAVAVSNRNLGTNQGHVAWQRSESPRILRILEDPCDYGAYSCLTAWSGGGVSIEDLRFDFAGDAVFDVDGRRLSDEVEWATFGQRVLRDGAVVRVDEIAHQFYDVRHVLAFDHQHPEGEAIRRGLYEGYPSTFRARVRQAWAEHGVPRSRYFHNAIGLSAGAVVIVQREGTVEEIGEALRTAGATDGLIIDNGGSVACWAWWVNNYAGGLLSPTVDYRPPGTSAIGVVLKGPMRPELPGGSVSYSTY